MSRRHHATVLALSAVLAWVGAGCAPTVSGTAQAAPTTSGTPRAVPVTGPVAGLIDPGEPARDFPIPSDGDLPAVSLANMKQLTLRMAGVPGTVTGTCTTYDADARRLDCVTAYNGMSLQWKISVAPAVMSGNVRTQNDTMTPRTGVIIARTVYGAFWNTYHDRSDQLRCDTVPDLAIIPVPEDGTGGHTTPYKCQYLGPMGANGLRPWTDVAVGYAENLTVKFGS